MTNQNIKLLCQYNPNNSQLEIIKSQNFDSLNSDSKYTIEDTDLTSGFAGNNDLTQTGNVIGDADWRATMPINIINGDGYKNVASSEIEVASDVVNFFQFFSNHK